MASDDKRLQVGETVYWIHRNRNPRGYGGKKLIYSLVEILSLTENRVQISERQFVPYGAVHRLDIFHTLDIPDCEGKMRAIISDSIRIRTYGGGDYRVEGVDSISGCNARLLEASGKGSITACRTFIHNYKPELQEIERRKKEDQLKRKEAARQAAEIKKVEGEKQGALDHIKYEQILNLYIEKEQTSSLARLRNTFLSISPKQIFIEAERCVADGIEVESIMQEGMMNGYMKALEWLYELHLQGMVLFPEIIVYNKQVYEYLTGFKNRFNPAPIHLPMKTPLLTFTNPACTPASFWYEGLFRILGIPTITAKEGNNLQKVEDLVTETGVKIVLCFMLEGNNAPERWSNDLAISLVERLQHRMEIKILVVVQNQNCFLERLKGLSAKNIIFCRSPLDVVDALLEGNIVRKASI